MNEYTPKSIADIVIGSVDGDYIVRNIVGGNLEFPLSGKSGFLIYGPFGTGKTTLAKMLPDEIERLHGNSPPISCCYDVDEDGKVNGKMLRNVQVAADLVPIFGKFNHIVIDEVDALSIAHQRKLRSLMTNPNSIFYFTTNNLSSVDGGVQSRCHLINMQAAPSQAWLKLFAQVLMDRGATVPSSQVMLPLIETCNGCIRDIVTAAQVLAAKRVASGPTLQADANAQVALADAA